MEKHLESVYKEEIDRLKNNVANVLQKCNELELQIICLKDTNEEKNKLISQLETDLKTACNYLKSKNLKGIYNIVSNELLIKNNLL